MHETRLIEPLIRGIGEHAAREGARSVTAIRLKVGHLLGTTEPALREAFAARAAGTMMASATLEMTVVPGACFEVLSFDIE